MSMQKEIHVLHEAIEELDWDDRSAIVHQEAEGRWASEIKRISKWYAIGKNRFKSNVFVILNGMYYPFILCYPSHNSFYFLDTRRN